MIRGRFRMTKQKINKETMKQYLISEEELIELKSKGYWYMDDKEAGIKNCVKDFLKSKTPVEVIAEGELFLSQENGITMLKDGKFINVDEKLYKYQGKKGKLIFIKDNK